MTTFDGLSSIVNVVEGKESCLAAIGKTDGVSGRHPTLRPSQKVRISGTAGSGESRGGHSATSAF
jgi:hypothetical protein